MKIVSWNVNSLRALLKKGATIEKFFQSSQWDVLCLQETKLSEAQGFALQLPFKYQYFASAQKKGYSGTAILSRKKPIASHQPDFLVHKQNLHPQEGRISVLEFPKFYLLSIYSPNAQDALRRLSYRLTFDKALLAYFKKLDKQKPIVACGDFNVANEPIDLARPKPNEGHAGYSFEERASFKKFLNAGFLDSFREKYPDLPHQYTWWSYRANARPHNVGWRLDYFLLSKRLMPAVKKVSILADIHGSDHCPVFLEM